MVTIFSGGMWSLIKQSDTTSTLILILLLIVSILCWSLFLYLILRMREQRHHIMRFIHKITVSNDLPTLMHKEAVHHTITGRYSKRVADLLLSIGSIRALDDRGWELLQQTLVQRAEQMLVAQEFATSLLSTSATVAPLLGLLGTVWGLVHAFMNIAATQSADIAAVAPGIAEALITTIAGLLVAIPALVMYNVTIQMHTGLREYMYELVDAVMLVLHKTQNQG